MTRWFNTIWYVLTLRCEEADRIRSVAASETLTRAERIGGSLHTALCRSCRNARRQVERLDQALRDLGESPAQPSPMPEAGRERIARAMSERLDEKDV